MTADNTRTGPTRLAKLSQTEWLYAIFVSFICYLCCKAA